MTVPAFSVSAALPGAPVPQTGTGAAVSAPAGGLFESLLAGFGAPSAAGRAARSGAGTSDVDPLAPEIRDWAQDAGLTALTPPTAPAFAPPSAPDAERAEETAPVVVPSRQGRVSSLFADRMKPTPMPVAANEGVEAGLAPFTAGPAAAAGPAGSPVSLTPGSIAAPSWTAPSLAEAASALVLPAGAPLGPQTLDLARLPAMATPAAAGPAGSPVSFTPGSNAAPSRAAPSLAEAASAPVLPAAASLGAQALDLARLPAMATAPAPSPAASIDAAPLPSGAKPQVGSQASTVERAGIQIPDQVQGQTQAGPPTQTAVAGKGPASTLPTPPLSDASAPPLAAAPAATNPAPVGPAPIAETLTAAAATPMASRPASQPEGDLRRPAATRADPRRAEGAARTVAAPAAGPAMRDAAQAVSTESLSAAAVADPDEPAAGSVAEVDLAETPEARVTALPSDLRAQAVQDADLAAETVANRTSAETVARLAADIVRKADGQSTRFDLQLDPHGLGKVDVALEIDRNGKLTAALSFDSAQSAADLRGRAGELRLALEQAGFDVAEGGLTFNLSGQDSGFSGREAGQQQDRAWNGRAFQRAQLGAEEADLSLASTPSILSPWTRSGVDIRI